jgi:CubicO group peptidase (beta-lactamase class C family)
VAKSKPKRNEPLPRPTGPGEWQLLPLDTAAAQGWDDLCRQAPGPTAGAYDALVRNPEDRSNLHRQHRLKGTLSRNTIKGVELEQWEYEVTGGGRIRYCPDPDKRIAWVVLASTRHPKDTE